MDLRSDPYAVLGVSPDSEEVVIRAAHRALKEKYAASAGARDAWDEQRALDVDAAYAVLRDPASRRAHDKLREGVERDGASAAATTVSPPVRSSPPRPDAPSFPGMRAPHRSRAWPAALLIAVVVGLALVGWLAMRPHHVPSTPHAARGLTIRKRYAVNSIRVARPMPCYVNGQPVGQLLLRDCATRNGVATGPLDVGLDMPALSRPPGSPSPVTPSPQFALVRPAVATAPSFARSLPSPPNRAAARPQSVVGAPAPAVSPTPRPAESIAAVRAFYAALGGGDGDLAAALVEPEKRVAGPLSAREMTRFYSSLREPLRLTQIYPLDDSTVFVRYRFVTPGGRHCLGAANVMTIQRGGRMLVRGIRAYNGC